VEFLQLAAEIPIRSTVRLYDLAQANEALLDVKHSRLNGEAVLRGRGLSVLWYNENRQQVADSG